MRRRALAGLLLAAGAAIAALTAPAAVAVTIGSDLAPEPNAAPSCVGTSACTLANAAVAGASAASPIDGVVVRWRVRSAGADVGGNPVRLKVARPSLGGAFTGISTSVTQTIPDTAGATTFVFETQQPIAAGDLVALDISAGNGNFLIRNLTPTDVAWLRWQPPLLDGQTRPPDGSFMSDEHMFNADVEPDCDSDGLGDDSQDTDASSCPPAPETAITKRPHDKTKKRKAKFEFNASELGASFDCSLDGGPFVPCSSPHAVKVKRGKHSFAVRASDAGGNVDGTPANDDWKVKKRKRK